MPNNILKTINIGADVLQMSESISASGERTVTISYVEHGQKKPRNKISFSTDSQSIYDTRALTLEGTILKSLESYYSILKADQNYSKIESQPIENAFQFLSKLEMYHMAVGDMPWLDVRFQFRPWYVVHSSPFSGLDHQQFNGGLVQLVLEVDFMDASIVFFTMNTATSQKVKLLQSARYELKLDHIYSALKKYARLTATPESISNTIIKSL